MWTPKQLLPPEVVDLLRQSGDVPEEYIEFLGWNAGRARALIKSKNPVKAAHTMLASDTAVKWLAVFFQKKRDSVKPPTVPDREEADKLLRQFRRFQSTLGSTWCSRHANGVCSPIPHRPRKARWCRCRKTSSHPRPRSTYEIPLPNLFVGDPSHGPP